VVEWPPAGPRNSGASPLLIISQFCIVAPFLEFLWNNLLLLIIPSSGPPSLLLALLVRPFPFTIFLIFPATVCSLSLWHGRAPLLSFFTSRLGGPLFLLSVYLLPALFFFRQGFPLFSAYPRFGFFAATFFVVGNGHFSLVARWFSSVLSDFLYLVELVGPTWFHFWWKFSHGAVFFPRPLLICMIQLCAFVFRITPLGIIFFQIFELFLCGILWSHSASWRFFLFYKSVLLVVVVKKFRYSNVRVDHLSSLFLEMPGPFP